MQGRPKGIIDGSACMPPSLDYLRLPLAEISEGGPKRKLGTEALSRAEPAVSHANHRFLGLIGSAGRASKALSPSRYANGSSRFSKPR